MRDIRALLRVIKSFLSFGSSSSLCFFWRGVQRDEIHNLQLRDTLISSFIIRTIMSRSRKFVHSVPGKIIIPIHNVEIMDSDQKQYGYILQRISRQAERRLQRGQNTCGSSPAPQAQLGPPLQTAADFPPSSSLTFPCTASTLCSMASTIELASAFIEGAPPGEVCMQVTL